EFGARAVGGNIRIGGNKQTLVRVVGRKGRGIGLRAAGDGGKNRPKTQGDDERGFRHSTSRSLGLIDCAGHAPRSLPEAQAVYNIAIARRAAGPLVTSVNQGCPRRNDRHVFSLQRMHSGGAGGFGALLRGSKPAGKKVPAEFAGAFGSAL